MSDEPKVSILISYYNDRDFIRQSIDSVLSQDYKNIEIVLLSHASTDGTRDIARSYDDDRIVHIDYPKNLGAVSGLLLRAMYERSTGKYIKFLSADDMIAPGGLRILVDYMEAHPEVGFAFGNVEYINSKGEYLGASFFDKRPGFCLNDDSEISLKKLYDGCSCLPYNGQIIRREAVRCEFFEPTFIMMVDMSLWARLLLDGSQIGFVNRIVGRYRIHPGQTSGTFRQAVALQRSRFERRAYVKFISWNASVKVLKVLEPEFEYLANVETREDVRFAIMYSQFKRTRDAVYYAELQSMLIDDDSAHRLSERFSFDVAELRKMYSAIDNNWRRKAREEPGEQANVKQLLFLLVRRFRNNLRDSKIIKRLRGVKEYTL